VTSEVRVPIVRVRAAAEPLPLPRYMTPGAAGLDLLADVPDDVTLGAGDRCLVPTGIALAIPPGYEGQVRPRSGRAVREGLTLLNAPGTVDADYRGEVQVLLVNLGREPVRIRRGDRIAQLVVAPVARVVWQEDGALAPSARGAGGFGSTDAAPDRREP
jgi:dUTP pyrophosphatase